MIEKHLPSFIMTILTAVALWVGVSISDLNKNVAVIIERTVLHEKRITKLEEKNLFNLTKGN